MSDSFVYLEKHNPEKNQHRYYVLSVQPNLFGTWSLVRTWGRIGRNRRTLIELHDTLESAEDSLRSKEREKLGRDYERA